jgi:hypothetical protein
VAINRPFVLPWKAVKPKIIVIRGVVMKTFTCSILTALLLVIAAPAWSDSALHVVSCQQDDDTGDEQVEVIAAEWFKAAKAIKGGENLELYLNFPVAAKAGEVDFAMILVAPSFAEWGAFMDNYPGSAAEAIDDKYEDDLDCGDGTLWDSMQVK